MPESRMNKSRKDVSDLDVRSDGIEKGMAKKLVSARVSAEIEPVPRKFGRANSIASGDDLEAVSKKIGRAHSIATSAELEAVPKKFGRANSISSSIRSHVNGDDDEIDLSGRDPAARPSAGVETVPQKFGRANSIPSSIRSYLSDDDEKDLSARDTVVSLNYKEGSQSQSNPRVLEDTSDSDPYAAVRVADTPRQKSSSSSPYASLTIADSPRLQANSSGSGRNSFKYDPYMQMKVTARPDDFRDGKEVIYDSDDSYDSGESGDDSYDSVHEDNDEMDASESESRSSSQEDDNESPKSYARVSVAGSAINTIREFPAYARVSIAGSEAGRPNDPEEEFAESIADSDPDGHEEEDGPEVIGRARVSVEGSERDGTQNEDENIPGYARISVAGSEAGHGQGIHTGGSVRGSETEQETQLYAKLSVAGSDAEHDDLTSEYPSCAMHGKGTQLGSQHGGGVAMDGPGPQAELLSRKMRQGSMTDTPEQQQSLDEIWSKEYQAYNVLNLETQARLQYRVRVILTSPLFELKQRKLSAFGGIYESKFGRGIELAGFTSAASLCLAMPQVVQRKPLESSGVLVLEDSIQNQRAVSGIRSGLRRIVYDALKSLPSRCPCSELEERCSGLLGLPLMKVLSEHGYDAPSVKALVQDMLDIVGYEEGELEPVVYLCHGAEDPALTDGLLIKSSPVAAKGPQVPQNIVPDGNELTKGVLAQKESLKIGTFVTLRSLRNELRRYGSFRVPSISSSIYDEVLKARLQMRVLLAFRNLGRGIEIRELPELYEKTFGKNIDLQALGFESLMELATFWQDIFLLQEPKPGWVVLVPSQANRRILNTLQTGLRASVFSVLVEIYPDGLDQLEFLHRLQQDMSGELWEVLEAAGYICSDAEKAESILSSSSSSDFQLVDFEEICVLLDDMIDFVRFGSNEDGSAVVKLRNGEVPLVDILECKLEDTDVPSVDELFVNLMMIAVDVSESSDADSLSETNEGINLGRVQSLVKSFEGAAGLRSAHSVAADSLKLKHELRLILGCPQYFDCGLAWNELSTVYKDRTGHDLGSRSKVKSLLRGMPDIVCKDSLISDRAILSKTPKNLRILSITKSGLRQVLFWVLVKNAGGVWVNFLEGWYNDFSGLSLAATLQVHGYEASKGRPFFPVYVFLRDMADLLQKKPGPHDSFVWTAGVEDPVHSDASLLGLSELAIQYDPRKGYPEIGSGREVELVVRRAVRLQDESSREELVQRIENAPVLQQSEWVGQSEPVTGMAERTVLDENEVWLVADAVDESALQYYKSDVRAVDDAGFLVSSEGDGDIETKSSKNSLSGGILEGPEYALAVTPSENNRAENLSKRADGSSQNALMVNEAAMNLPTVKHEGMREPVIDVTSVNNVVVECTDSNSRVHHTRSDQRTALDVQEDFIDSLEGHQVQELQGEGISGNEDNAKAADELENRGTREHHPPVTTREGTDSVGSAIVYGEASLLQSDKLRADLGATPESSSESYAQLRVASKGANVNLDEWQFTDSEDEEEEGEVEDDDEDEYSQGSDDEEMQEEEGAQDDENGLKRDEQSSTQDPNHISSSALERGGNATEPRGKVIGKDTRRTRGFPNKIIPWK